MFYNFFRVGLLSLILFNFNASAESSSPIISEEEANKYEIAYLKEYEELKKSVQEPTVKWIQPKNKKEACKVYVGIDSKDDHTLKDSYALYWDGDCKDGYAYGLGREMEYRDYSYHYQIGIYKNGMPEDYCVNINEAEGITIEGTCNYSKEKPDYRVYTKIKENEKDLELTYQYGSFNDVMNPYFLVASSPFLDKKKFIKAYPNFKYSITDFSNDEFESRKYQFEMTNKNNRTYGYSSSVYKNNKTFSGETIDGKRVRQVELDKKYTERYYDLLLEIQQEADKALSAQEKAIIIKTKYKMKICKDKIKVTFIDNDEYKSICEEDKKFGQLRVKINEKLDRLNLAKQQKRQQLNEDKIRQAQQNTANKTEALAQQRAAIAEEALEEQRRANLNQGFQNLNQTLQLQQLNRNTSWDALTPKRFDVYMH